MKNALCVGINHFKRPGNDLAGCVPDAEEMGAVFANLGATPTVITNASVIRQRVLAELDAMSLQARIGKLAYFAFAWSGHGTHYAQSLEDDGLGEALICYDCDVIGDEWNPDTIIKDTELRNILNQFPPSCTVEVWLDTCYSGGMDRVLSPHKPFPAIISEGRFLHNPGNPTGHLRVANSTISQGLNSNIIMWCASSEPQESADAYIAGGAHGAFTFFWCEAFKKNPKASRVELLLATRKALSANGYDQFPRLKCWNGPAQMMVGP